MAEKLNSNIAISVFGAGYVGMSLSTLLAEFYTVNVIDTDPNKVKLINNKKSTVKDSDINKYLSTKDLRISSSGEIGPEEYNDYDFFIIATPTDYDEATNFFNTSSVEKIIENILKNTTKDSLIIIKSRPFIISDFNEEEEARESKTIAGLKLANKSSSFLILRSPLSGLLSKVRPSHCGPPTAPKSIASETLSLSRTLFVNGSPNSSIELPPTNSSVILSL